MVSGAIECHSDLYGFFPKSHRALVVRTYWRGEGRDPVSQDPGGRIQGSVWTVREGICRGIEGRMKRSLYSKLKISATKENIWHKEEVSFVFL